MKNINNFIQEKLVNNQIDSKKLKIFDWLKSELFIFYKLFLKIKNKTQNIFYIVYDNDNIIISDEKPKYKDYEELTANELLKNIFEFNDTIDFISPDTDIDFESSYMVRPKVWLEGNTTASNRRTFYFYNIDLKHPILQTYNNNSYYVASLNHFEKYFDEYANNKNSEYDIYILSEFVPKEYNKVLWNKFHDLNNKKYGYIHFNFYNTFNEKSLCLSNGKHEKLNKDIDFKNIVKNIKSGS